MALVKVHLKNISKDHPTPADVVEVKLNPTEYSITRGATYAEIAVPGLAMPLQQFIRGDAQTLSMELFLDGSDERRSVKDRLDALRAFVTIDGHLHAPPVCEVAWGDTTFQGVVTTLAERFVLFGESGEILRARVTLTVKSFRPADVQAREINPRSPDRTKTRVVREGERLDMIAEAEYNDPTLWPIIARHNNIARPRFLRPGTVLEIPPL